MMKQQMIIMMMNETCMSYSWYQEEYPAKIAPVVQKKSHHPAELVQSVDGAVHNVKRCRFLS